MPRKVYARKSKLDDYRLNKLEQTFMFYRQNPVEIMRDICMKNPTWFQRITFRDLWDKPFIVLKWGRGASKTATIAWYLVSKAMFFSDMRIGIIAPSYRQAQFVFDEIDSLYAISPYVRRSCKQNPSRSNDRAVLRFNNRSFIEALPIGTQGAKIRGRRYSIVFLDETAQIDGDTIGMVIMPMLSNMLQGRRNQIIYASSPFFPEAAPHFYEACLQHKAKVISGNDDYHYSSYNFIDVLLDQNPDFVPDVSFIERALEMSPEDIFMMEWLGIFPGESHGFFSTQLVESCTPRGIRDIISVEFRGESGAKYALGIDPARSPRGDLFAMSILKILKDGTRHVVKVIADKGVKFPDMANAIRREVFLNNFNIVAIYMDSRGGGRELQDLLDSPWEHNGITYPPIVVVNDDEIIGQIEVLSPQSELRILRMIDFNTVAINDMYFKFKSLMEQGKILFPIDLHRHEDMFVENVSKEIIALKNEMRVLQTKPTVQGLKFDCPKGFTKDRITASVLANFAANEISTDINNSMESAALTSMLEAGGWIR